MTLFWIAFHVCLNALLGVCILLYQKQGAHERSLLETLLVGTLLGWLLEVVLIAVLLYAQIPFRTACVFSFLVIVAFILVAFFSKRKSLGFVFPRLKPWRWYEWLLLVSVLEKLGFIVWQFTSTRVWADDALTHWAGRGRCLFGGVNWSLDPHSPVFLGHTSGAKNYPLGIPIWRAVTAALNGGWNDMIARADSLLFFILVLLSVWVIVYRFSQKRFLAAGATFIVAALPFHVWHGAVGYSDIGVEAVLMGALICYFWEAWFLAGILIAGSAWIKNEGLIIYLPAFLLGLGVQWMPLWLRGDSALKKTILKSLAWFVSGALLILGPRLLFNLFYHQDFRNFGAAPGISLHPEALKIFFETVIAGPTHNLYWALTPLFLGLSFSSLWPDSKGRFLITFLVAALLEFVWVYFFTGAFYDGLENQAGIHRSLLQLYGLSVVVLTYGVWLHASKHLCKK